MPITTANSVTAWREGDPDNPQPLALVSYDALTCEPEAQFVMLVLTDLGWKATYFRNFPLSHKAPQSRWDDLLQISQLVVVLLAHRTRRAVTHEYELARTRRIPTFLLLKESPPLMDRRRTAKLDRLLDNFPGTWGRFDSLYKLGAEIRRGVAALTLGQFQSAASARPASALDSRIIKFLHDKRIVIPTGDRGEFESLVLAAKESYRGTVYFGPTRDAARYVASYFRDHMREFIRNNRRLVAMGRDVKKVFIAASGCEQFARQVAKQHRGIRVWIHNDSGEQDFVRALKDNVVIIDGQFAWITPLREGVFGESFVVLDQPATALGEQFDNLCGSPRSYRYRRSA